MKSNMSPRNFLKTAALIGMALLLPLTAFAQQNSDDAHWPASAAPADVDHHQNQAVMAAQQPDPETRAAIQAEMRAGQAVQAATHSDDDQALERARTNHRTAEMHAEALVARTCGTTPEQIAAMRSQGMGWGQIARNMGVHPGALGLGHDASGDQAEMRQAMTRNMETGQSAMQGDRSGAADMGASNGTMSQKQEQNHTRNTDRSHMGRNGAGSRAGHSSRTGHGASHGGGHHH